MELVQRVVVTHELMESIRNQYGPEAGDQMLINELTAKLAQSLISACRVSISNITNQLTLQTEVELKLIMPDAFDNHPINTPTT